MTFKIAPYLCPLLLLAAAPARSEQNHFRHSLSGFAQYADAHFVELDQDGETINEEEGTLLFSGANFYWEWRSGLFAEISYKAVDDALTYRGLSQLGYFIESETEYFIRDTQLLFGRNFGPTAAFLGAGSRYRERNILATGTVAGLYEEMDTSYGLFGLRATLFANKPFQIRLDGRISTDVKTELKAVSENFDPLVLEPGKQFSAEGSVEFLFSLFGGVTLSLTPSYEYVRIAESDTHRVYRSGVYFANATHPETEYEFLSLTAELSWYF